MITILFVVGLLTSLGCGFNIITAQATWLHEVVWFAGGAVGAAMMVLAILLSNGWQP